MGGEFEVGDRVRAVEIEPGLTVVEAADRAGILLNTRCGHVGTCGGCAVDLVSGRFDLGEPVGEVELSGDRRRALGCRTRILSPEFRIAVPPRSLVAGGEKVLSTFRIDREIDPAPTVRRIEIDLAETGLDDPRSDLDRLRDGVVRACAIDVDGATLAVLRTLPALTAEGSATRLAVHLALGADGSWTIQRVAPPAAAEDPGDAGPWGLAIDLGTTTVAMALVDLASGRIVDAASSYNQQVRRCDDVASRIGYSDDGLEELRVLVVEETVNKLARVLCARHDIDTERIARVSVSGNTVMTHIFLGVSPHNIGALPFNPAANAPGPYAAGELGIATDPDALVDVAPGMSGYVGGDITSDLYLAGAADWERPALLVDIGTNGEMVIGDRDRMVTCATPAGPAWEGGGLQCGVRAAVGAIEAIRLDPDSFEPTVDVIGDVAPSGICGTAYIDFLAEALRAGLITPMGRIDPGLVGVHPRVLTVRSVLGGEVTAFVVVDADRTENGERPLVVTEPDIGELLMGKAAIFSGVRVLAARFEIELADLDRVVLAGGFARHIRVENAITIGLLPDLPRDRYRVIGNGSLAGAWLALVERDATARMRRLAAHPRVVELNTDPRFETECVNALVLPNLDGSLFPSVRNTRA